MFTYITSLFRASKLSSGMPPGSNINTPSNNIPSEDIYKLTSPSSSTSTSQISLPNIAQTAEDFADPSTSNSYGSPWRAPLNPFSPFTIPSNPTKTQRPKSTTETTNSSDHTTRQSPPQGVQVNTTSAEDKNAQNLQGMTSTDGVFDRPPPPIDPMIHPPRPPTPSRIDTVAANYEEEDFYTKQEIDAEIKAMQQGCILQRICCFCCPD
ncbi:hypothetical protein TWF569_008152 [Orbilia oligospora]|uniref:Uncharacterized protein n=1 Tax=Orbilia oligospora TaxID=2813651 RepID=A0A7C8NLK3_ORBOL|nr:hypothetical protein TWF102_003571 [Orbilia oligospora]KAF3080046.1 hypothetical protein TWF706_003032 [Orbilia oligospora]KAF3080345.1 hypothetical protein TWF103_004216 [Orbilia oligospora]KAF3120428.1 hypothetical protein TWF594_003883 [Orbilia oligospora]KAF3124443.1 hypothetical protein TWF703_000432 [Orbilia oligospora]